MPTAFFLLGCYPFIPFGIGTSQGGQIGQAACPREKLEVSGGVDVGLVSSPAMSV